MRNQCITLAHCRLHGVCISLHMPVVPFCILSGCERLTHPPPPHLNLDVERRSNNQRGGGREGVSAGTFSYKFACKALASMSETNPNGINIKFTSSSWASALRDRTSAAPTSVARSFARRGGVRARVSCSPLECELAELDPSRRSHGHHCKHHADDFLLVRPHVTPSLPRHRKAGGLHLASHFLPLC